VFFRISIRTLLISIFLLGAAKSQEVQISPYGIGCRTYQAPNDVGPPSYSVADIGKPGVPTLSTEQLALIRRIRHYIASNTLRFAFVSQWGFVVFDAVQGPCPDGAPGYEILNSNRNLYYQPGEAPGFVHAGPPTAPQPSPEMTSIVLPKSIDPAQHQIPVMVVQGPQVFASPHLEIRYTRGGTGLIVSAHPTPTASPRALIDLYRVVDVGKRGVPALSARQLLWIARIKRTPYYKTRIENLWFSPQPASGGWPPLIVFDAGESTRSPAQPQNGMVGSYWVIGDSCNAVFWPTGMGEMPLSDFLFPVCESGRGKVAP
jgi:hypothetical protein